jgi:hypothetical protein
MIMTTRTRARLKLVAWLAAAGCACGVTAPSSAQSIGNGTLLVASPQLADPNFARAVVLVLRHDDDGTIGLILKPASAATPAACFEAGRSRRLASCISSGASRRPP